MQLLQHNMEREEDETNLTDYDVVGLDNSGYDESMVDAA